MYDFAIVGSGVSGGLLARELTESGASCVLIEAGRNFSRKNFPMSEVQASSQLFWGGGVEFTSTADLGLLRGKCLGGTSVVNQGLLNRFDDQVFNDWKNRTDFSCSVDAVKPYYKRIREKIQTARIPKEEHNQNATLFIRAFKKQGYEWGPVLRAQGNCAQSDCIACLGGCPRHSKQSSLATHIPIAAQQGLKIETRFQVDSVQASPRGVSILGSQFGILKNIQAGKVILAAGSLGTSKILLRSGIQKRLKKVGKGFSCHPQFMTLGLFDEPVDAHRGSFQAVHSDDVRFRRAGYKYENVYAGPVAIAMLMPGFGLKHLQRMQNYRHYASMEVCLRDEPTGEILMSRSGRLKIKKKLTDLDQEKRKEGVQIAQELFQRIHAQEVVRCEQGFGLHLMGGAAIGVNGATSVVSPEFNLHDENRILIADSSIFPSAPGINPSFTIMALSLMLADQLLGRK